MAIAIEYFATPKIAHCRITVGFANTDGTGVPTAVTWYNTAPATNWMLTKVIFSSSSGTGVGDLADCLLHCYVSDGTTVRRIRSIDIANPVAGSVTAMEGQYEIEFGPAFVFPATVLPQFSVSVSPTAGNLDVVVFAQAA